MVLGVLFKHGLPTMAFDMPLLVQNFRVAFGVAVWGSVIVKMQGDRSR